MRGCSVEGCERPHRGRGFCELHRSRDAAGVPLDKPVERVKTPASKRSRTSGGAVQLGITLQPDMADQLLEAAGTAYGAQAKLVRAAIVHYLGNRDTAFWRRKYQEERMLRLALQQRINDAKGALG